MSCQSNKVIEALGDKLLSKDGEVSTSEALKGKTVLGLYFSAHWCPPCRGFTPTLGKRYTALKEAGKDFELVFISGDRDQKSFDEYRKEMSFLAMPFDNDEGNEALNEMFEVQGIPSLVFVDAATGELITNEGREGISKDDFVEKFPYQPKPFNFFESLGDTLKAKSGTVSTAEAVKGKSVLGLYFSAHWCPPCRGFTPQLGKKYTALKEAGKDFELVFVSSDRDEKSFEEYHNEMPFLAQPYSNRDGKAELSKAFGVSGIPALVFVEAATGKLITDEGRGGISADSFIEDFPYYPKPVNDLGVSTSGIDSKSSLILFMEDSSPEEQKALTNTLTELAEAEKNKPETEQAVKCFFTATGSGPVNQIRSACKLEMVVKPHQHELKEEEGSNWGCDGCGKPSSKAKKRFRCTEGCDFDYCGECQDKSTTTQKKRDPCLLILNLSAGGKYFACPDAVNADTIRSFMKDFADKKLTSSTWGS